jgi:hypothetical protein
MSVIAGYQVNGANPVTVGGTGTTIKYFSNVPGAAGFLSGTSGVNSGVSSNNLPNTPSATSNAGGLQVPGFAVLNGQVFSATAAGNIYLHTSGSGVTGTVGMYLSTQLPNQTPTYQTLVALTVTNPTAATYLPWFLNMQMQGDTSSGMLQLIESGAINGVVTVPTQVTALTGINFSSNPAFTLVVGVTFNTSDSLNSANLYQFQVSLP